MTIICMLSQKSDGGLSIIFIKLWHIQVIDEVNHDDFSGGSKLTTCLLFQSLFQLRLEIVGICVIVEVDNLESIVLWFIGNNFLQDTLGELSFTRTGVTNQEALMFREDIVFNEIRGGNVLNCWDGDVTHQSRCWVEIHGNQTSRPF